MMFQFIRTRKAHCGTGVISAPDSTKNPAVVHRISDNRLHLCILTIAIPLIVGTNFSSIIFPLSDTRTLPYARLLCILSCVRMIFLIRQLVRMLSCDLSRVVFSTAFNRLCLDEVHTTFPDQRLVSLTEPQQRISLLSVSQLLVHTEQLALKIGFVTFTARKSYRFV